MLPHLTNIVRGSLIMPNQPSICPKRCPVEPSETHKGLFWMDSLKSLDFSSFIIFSDDPWSLLVSFCQLFKLPLVVQCCNVICEWPLKQSKYWCIPVLNKIKKKENCGSTDFVGICFQAIITYNLRECGMMWILHVWH